MNSNLDLLGLSYKNYSSSEISKFKENGIKCYLGDATVMEEELDKYNWFFLFNPFTLKIMSTVLNHICESIVRAPRKVHILYAEPIGHNLIMETELFRICSQICSDYSEVSYYTYIYENIQ